MTLCSCARDPARALVPVLQAMPAAGIPLGDVLADSGYAHRDAAAWAIPLRHAGAQLIQDLHPSDRGPQGTHHGAIIATGNLYCPQTPLTLLQLAPLPPGAAPGQVAIHDQQAAELAKHKLSRITADDADGYHRVTCPAAAGKIRCPLRPESMKRDRGRPEILTPPGHPPACCTQQTITIPPAVTAKTRHKHHYPLAGAPAVLQPPHRRRAHLRHHQGPRRHHHQPRLAPPHGPDPARAMDRLPADRPQPAHPGRLPRPAGRQRTQNRTRPAAQNPQAAPRHTRQPRRAAITSPATLTPARIPPAKPPPQSRTSSSRANGHPARPSTPKITSAAGPQKCQSQKCEHRQWPDVKTSGWI
jgi:hypothetical protein